MYIIWVRVVRSCCCNSRFQRAFTACCCVLKVIVLVWANQGNYFENANACSKRALKTTVATDVTKWPPLCQKLCAQAYENCSRGLVKLTPGVDSPNLKLKLAHFFAKRCSPFAQFVRRKKHLILFSRKNCENMSMKSTPGLSLRYQILRRSCWISLSLAKKQQRILKKVEIIWNLWPLHAPLILPRERRNVANHFEKK